MATSNDATGTCILQAADGAGPKSRKYRGKLTDCLRAYALLARKQSSGMAVSVWELGEKKKGFHPLPAADGAAWTVAPFGIDQVRQVEDLGLAEPVQAEASR